MLFATAELNRSKRQYIMLTLGTGLLVFVLLFVQGLLNAVLDGMAGAIARQSAPVVVYTKDAQRVINGSMLKVEQVEAVRKAPEVGEAAELGVSLLTFTSPRAGRPFGFNVVGFHPGQPGEPLALKSGRLPQAAGEAVVSVEAATDRVELGDTIRPESGGPALKIVGFTEGMLLSVGPTAWTPWETYEQLYKPANPEAKEVLAQAIAVQPKPGRTAEQAVSGLAAAFPDLDPMTRETAVATVPGRDAIKGAFSLMLTLCYVVVGVVIGFFFLTMTLHKEASITLMRAIGMQGGYLVRCLLYQVALVTTGGVVLGVLMMFVAKPLVRTAVTLQIDGRALSSVAVPALLVAVLGAVASIRRILRTDPNDIVARPLLGSVS
jgi:hypothetical protein